MCVRNKLEAVELGNGSELWFKSQIKKRRRGGLCLYDFRAYGVSGDYVSHDVLSAFGADTVGE